MKIIALLLAVSMLIALAPGITVGAAVTPMAKISVNIGRR